MGWPPDLAAATGFRRWATAGLMARGRVGRWQADNRIVPWPPEITGNGRLRSCARGLAVSCFPVGACASPARQLDQVRLIEVGRVSCWVWYRA